MSKADIQDIIRNQIESNDVLLYMKGTPEAPECGFSAQAVAALKACSAQFAYVNILAAPSIRERLPSVSGWPTFRVFEFRFDAVLHVTGVHQASPPTALAVASACFSEPSAAMPTTMSLPPISSPL